MTMPVEFYVIAGGVAAVLAIWLLMRYGKIIARAGLIAGVLIVAIVLALAAYEHSRATRQAVQVATVAGAGTAGASVAVAILAALLAAALCACLVLFACLKLARRRASLPRPRPLSRLPRPREQQRLGAGPRAIVNADDYTVQLLGPACPREPTPEELREFGW